jgi:hypothetical protein
MSKEFPFMIDMAKDRLISRKQLVRRYGEIALVDVKRLIPQGLIEQYKYKPVKGGMNHLYHLTPFGRAMMSDQLGIPLVEIPYTRGVENQTFHTLWVGEVRWQSEKEGLKILPDYQNLVQRFSSRVSGYRPDMYILDNGVPTIAVEIDLSISVVDTKQKVQQWKHEGLRVWWYYWGRRASQKFINSDIAMSFDKLCNLDDTGWIPFNITRGF